MATRAKKGKLRWDAYIRVSMTGARDTESESYRTVKQQKEAIEHWADRNGQEIVRWVVDENTSGAKRNRPKLNAIVERIKLGQTDGIVVYAVNRLSRMNLADAWQLINDITLQYKGKVAAIEMGDEFDPRSIIGESMITQQLGWARIQSRQTGKRIRQSMVDALTRGVYISNTTPFGYARVDAHGNPASEHFRATRLVIDPVEGPIVTEIYRRRVHGHSWQDIVLWLRSTGTRPPAKRQRVWEPGEDGRRKQVTIEPERTREWGRKAVMALVSKPIYKGWVINKHDGGGEGEDPVMLFVDSLQLADEDTWEDAQQVRNPRGGVPPGNRTMLVRGKAHCASCRYTLQALPRLVEEGPTYRCRITDHPCPAPVQIRAGRSSRSPKTDRAREIIDAAVATDGPVGRAIRNRDPVTGMIVAGGQKDPVRAKIVELAAAEGISARTVQAALNREMPAKPRFVGLDQYVMDAVREKVRRYRVEGAAFEREDKRPALEDRLAKLKTRLARVMADEEEDEDVRVAAERDLKTRIRKTKAELARYSGPASPLDVASHVLDQEDLGLEDWREIVLLLIKAVVVWPANSGGYGAPGRTHIYWFDDELPEFPRQGQRLSLGPIPFPNGRRP